MFEKLPNVRVRVDGYIHWPDVKKYCGSSECCPGLDDWLASVDVKEAMNKISTSRGLEAVPLHSGNIYEEGGWLHPALASLYLFNYGAVEKGFPELKKLLDLIDCILYPTA